MKYEIPFGVLLAVGFIGYWIGKRIGRMEGVIASANVASDFFAARKAERESEKSHPEQVL